MLKKLILCLIMVIFLLGLAVSCSDPKRYNIKITPPAATSTNKISIEKQVEPRDIIYDTPLYIEYTADYVNNTKETRFIESGETDGRRLIVDYSWRLESIRVCNVTLDDDMEFCYDSLIFKEENISSDYTISFDLNISDSTSDKAIIFIDFSGAWHSYLLIHNNQDDSLSVIEQNVFKHTNVNIGIKNVSGDSDSIPVRFYTYTGDYSSDIYDEKNWQYITEDISIQNFHNDFLYFLYSYTGITSWAFHYEGTKKICFDLHFSKFYDLLSDTPSDKIYEHILLKTIASLPNIEEIEILLGGEMEREGDYFKFGTTNVKNYLDLFY